MNRVQLKFIEDAMEQEEKLTDWERGFIDDLSNMDEDRELTVRQNEVLNQITTRLNRGY